MSQQIVNCERGLLQGLISATFINIATKGRVLIRFIFTSGINKKDTYWVGRIWKIELYIPSFLGRI